LSSNEISLNVVFLESTKLPSPDIFGKSLYTFYIGQNDFTSNGIVGAKQSAPQVVSQIASTIKVNYFHKMHGM
jgi:hypothetical protein